MNGTIMKYFPMEEAYFDQVLDTIPMGIVFTDKEGIIVRANARASRLLGRETEWLTRLPVTDTRWEMVYEDGRKPDREMHPVMITLQTGKAHLNTIVGMYNQDEGNYYWFRVSAFPLPDEGGPSACRVLCTFEDITNFKQASDELALSEARFQQIFQESPFGMAILGSDFRFLRANLPFCKMTGYTEKELEPLTFKELTHPEHLEQDFEAVKKLLYGVIPNYKTVKRYIRKDQEIVWASLTLLAIHDQAGHFLHFLALVCPHPGHGTS